MALGRGHQAYVLVAPETTYGTAATTGFQKLEVMSVSCEPIIGMVPDGSMYNARARRALYQAGILYRGTLRVRGNYEGLTLLMRAAMLGYAYAQAAVGPPAANNHTFTDGTTLRSLTMQMQEGGVAATVQQVVGLVVTGWSTRITAGAGGEAMLQYEFNFVAKDKVVGVTENASPLAFPAVNPVLYHQCITQVDGSGDASPIIRGIEVSYQSPYIEDRYQLGSINPLQPIPNDFVTTSIRVTRDFDSLALFNAAKAFSAPAAALDFVFQAAVITGAHRFETQFKLSNARISDYGNPVEDYGIITATATWLGYYSATDASSLLVRMKNSDIQLT